MVAHAHISGPDVSTPPTQKSGASDRVQSDRVGVKTMPKRGLAQLRKRMTDECVARVKRQRALVLAQLRSGQAGDLPEPSHEDKLRVLKEVAHDIISTVQNEREGGADVGDDDQVMMAGVDDLRDERDEYEESEFLEMMRHIEEAVIAEILEQEQREQAQLQEYLDYEREEEEALQDPANHDEDDAVTCPVCLQAALRKHATTFFCECGMRLNVFGDQLTMPQLKDNLQASFDDHSASGCASRPICAIQECGGYDMLTMVCSDCDYMNIVA